MRERIQKTRPLACLLPHAPADSPTTHASDGRTASAIGHCRARIRSGERKAATHFFFFFFGVYSTGIDSVPCLPTQLFDTHGVNVKQASSRDIFDLSTQEYLGYMFVSELASIRALSQKLWA